MRIIFGYDVLFLCKIKKYFVSLQLKWQKMRLSH